MKKHKSFVLAGILFFITKASFAFMEPPPGPGTPTAHIPQDAILAVKNFFKDAQTKIEDFQKDVEESLNDIKSNGKLIPFKTEESPFKKKDGEPTNPALKEIVPSKTIDITNEEEVSEKFQELFLKYPMDLINSLPVENREYAKKVYRNKRIEFANDCTLELDVAVRDLEEKRLPAIEKEIKELSKCFVQGKEGTSATCQSASPSDEELGNVVNEYKLHKIKDNYARMMQELIALKIQSQAAMALQKNLEPVNEDEKIKDSDKTSFDLRHYEKTQRSSFAQAFLTENVKKESVAPEKEKIASSPKTQPKGLELVPSPKYKEHSPFEGAEDNLKALPVLDGIYQLYSKAQKMHNMKQQMPDLRGPFIEYAKMTLLHEKAIEKLVQSEKNVYDYWRTYLPAEDAADLWFGKGCNYKSVKVGERCVSPTGCVADAGYEIYERSLVSCPDDVFSVTAYDKRRGLSAEAIDAFKLAKADSVLALGNDALNLPIINTNADVDLSSGEKSLSAVIGNQKLEDESTGQYAEEELRAQDLNRWQIGSEISKRLGKDEGGQISYPIWEDQKLFYDQYILEKYKNILVFFNQPQAQVAVFDIAKKISNAMKIDENDVNAYKNSLSDDDENKAQKVAAYRKKLEEKLHQIKNQTSTRISSDATAFEKKIATTEQSALAALKQKFDQDMLDLSEKYAKTKALLEEKKEEAFAQIDDLRAKMNEKKTHYNTLKSEIDGARSQIESENLSKNVADERLKKDPSYVSRDKETADENIKEQENIAQSAESQAETVLEGVEADEETMESLNQKVKKYDEDIKSAQKDYITEAVALEATYFDDMHHLIDANLSGLSLPVIAGAPTGDTYTDEIYAIARSVFEGFRQNAQQAVNRAHQKIVALGEEKYTQGELVLSIHKQMLAEIKKAAVASVTKRLAGIVISSSSVVNNASDVIYLAMLNGDCAGAGCDKPDTLYFVGLTPKARDFTAPKALTAERYPPLREVLHFDGADFENVLKIILPNNQVKTSRKEFLAAINYVPEIWTLILGSNGFVERDVDVAQILNGREKSNNPLTALLSDIKQYVENEQFLKAKGESPAKLPVGELSLLLKYDDGLTFTKSIMDIMAYFDEDSEADVDEIKEYEHRLLTRNQIGDYLMFVDTEEIYQTELDNLKVKMDEARRDIEEVLQDAYCPNIPMPEKLSVAEYIANQTTYDAVLKCLEDNKNLFISEGLKLEGQLPVPFESEYLIERKAKLDRMRRALEMDNEELVFISDNTEPDTKLTEKIKTKRADNQVIGRYGEEAMAEFERNMEQFEEPFRARY